MNSYKTKVITVAMAILGIVAFTGCEKEPVAYGKADHSAYPIKQCLRDLSGGNELYKNELIDKIEVYKSARMMYAYHNDKKVFESRMSLGKNADKGNKLQAGDYRTPEGTYKIVRKKCDSRLYRSLMISYPNAKDIDRATVAGVRPGAYITIHGQPKWNADGRGDAYTLAHDWTEGCMAVPNKKMQFLWHRVANGTTITIHH